MENIVFNSGVTIDSIFAHRGDIFTVDGLFKNINEIDKDDHIICKENRPVLIISDDNYNSHIVKVLPLSSKGGNDHNNTITSFRCIKIPNVQNRVHQETYIDTSQIFTINTYQLKYKLATVSREIVDAAVAIAFMQNINKSSAATIVKYIQEQYPYINYGNSAVDESTIINNTFDPYCQLFSKVKRVSEEEIDKVEETVENEKDRLIQISTLEEAIELYKEWRELGTDIIRNKYKLTKQEYFAIRDKCVRIMLGKVNNFTKFSWEG